MFMNKPIYVFACLVFLSLNAFAQSAVIITPLEGEGTLTLYPLEVREYKMTIVNISQTSLDNIGVKLSVPEELAIVVNGEDKTTRFYSFISLDPNQQEEKIFQVKALRRASQPLEIKAEYGGENFNNSSSTSVMVQQSGFSFSSRLSRTSLEPGQEGSVIFDISNNSGERITNIKAELFSSDRITIETPPFDLELLESGQSIANTEFFFTLGSETGQKTLVLRVFFEDLKGKHLLEKSFPLDVQNRDVYVVFLVIAVLFLVIISLYMRRKKTPKEVDTQGIKVQNIKGEEEIKHGKEKEIKK